MFNKWPTNTDGGKAHKEGLYPVSNKIMTKNTVDAKCWTNMCIIHRKIGHNEILCQPSQPCGMVHFTDGNFTCFTWSEPISFAVSYSLLIIQFCQDAFELQNIMCNMSRLITTYQNSKLPASTGCRISKGSPTPNVLRAHTNTACFTTIGRSEWRS